MKINAAILSEKNALGNNIGVYEMAAIATLRISAHSSVARKVGIAIEIVSIASISQNEHFPANSGMAEEFFN